jgi:hypothetical protein
MDQQAALISALRENAAKHRYVNANALELVRDFNYKDFTEQARQEITLKLGAAGLITQPRLDAPHIEADTEISIWRGRLEDEATRDGRSVQTAGFVCALLSLLMPLLGLPGLILGAITATKPGRGGIGATIIILSVLLSGLSSVYWYEHFLKKAENEVNRTAMPLSAVPRSSLFYT